MSEFQNVFAEVSICPETMELLQKSLRETHFEATATCFEYSVESQGFRRGVTWETPSGPLEITRDPTEGRSGPRNLSFQRRPRIDVGVVFKQRLDVLKFWVQGIAGADISVFLTSPCQGDAHGRSYGLLFSAFAMSESQKGNVIA